MTPENFEIFRIITVVISSSVVSTLLTFAILDPNRRKNSAVAEFKATLIRFSDVILTPPSLEAVMSEVSGVPRPHGLYEMQLRFRASEELARVAGMIGAIDWYSLPDTRDERDRQSVKIAELSRLVIVRFRDVETQLSLMRDKVRGLSDAFDLNFPG